METQQNCMLWNLNRRKHENKYCFHLRSGKKSVLAVFHRPCRFGLSVFCAAILSAHNHHTTVGTGFMVVSSSGCPDEFHKIKNRGSVRLDVGQ